MVHNQGHLGINRKLEQVQAMGWWPTMQEGVEWCVNNCLSFVAYSPDTKTIKGPLGHQQIENVWNKVQVECINLPCSKREFKYCLMIVDHFTKWTETMPLWRNDARTTAQVLVEHI